ncbi:MAG: DUF2202 domain-containing protein [Bacteroidales bacterium]|nr:DUF2202 domain-containing protein [Bacteroidales bacterium]
MKSVKNLLVSLTLLMISTPLLLGGCQKSSDVEESENYLKATSPVTVENEIYNEDCIVTPPDTIYPFEISMLEFMREEEKLARDVYLTLYGQFQIPVFNNISNSEQIHMDRVLYLLNFYGIPDPAQPEIGQFTNPDLQDVYNALVQQGSASLVAALTVGATIEDLDIADLNEHIAETGNEAIQVIFGHLRCGSTNHLRAFTRLLSFHDVIYEPSYISQEEYEDIINGTFADCMSGVNTMAPKAQ